jgi:hypothetical protein
MMERSELELFEQSIRRATSEFTGAPLDQVLVDIGWRDALAEDARSAVSILFELQGRAAAASSMLGEVLVSGLGPNIEPTRGVILPALGGHAPPAHAEPGGITVDGLALASILDEESALVVARGPGGDVVATLDVTALQRQVVGGMDPLLELVEVTGLGAPLSPTTPLEPERWAEGAARAQLAVGHELVGVATTMIELARTHALERVQFGRPISTFQAVRHRLADAFVAVEGARALLDAAWEDGSVATAAMAKSVSGRAAATATRHCQQVLAGMGFTTEHPFQRYVRRALVLDQLFGTSRSLTAELGRDTLESRQLPELIAL